MTPAFLRYLLNFSFLIKCNRHLSCCVPQPLIFILNPNGFVIYIIFNVFELFLIYLIHDLRLYLH